MPISFQALIELLEQQLANYRQMADYSERKRQVLIANEIEQLEQLVNQESALVSKINILEKKRQIKTKEICTALHLDADSITFRELITYAVAEEQAPLQEIYHNFEQIAKEVGRLNDINRKLLEASIEYNELIISLALPKEDPLNNFYGEDGSETEGREIAPSLFDQQI